MQASQEGGDLDGSNRLYYHPVQELEASICSPFQNLDHCLFSLDGSQEINFVLHTRGQICAIDSFMATGGYPFQNSPSTVSFSPLGSPDSQSCTSDPRHSPENNISSALTQISLMDNINDVNHNLRELETAMLGPGYDTSSLCGYNIIPSELENWMTQMIEMVSRRDLKNLLIACAKAIGDNDLSRGEWLMTEVRQMVSVSGDPLQRIGAYMMEGLIARLASSGSSIYKALKCKEPTSPELLSYMHILYEICPYFKFGYMSANGAIAEAMKDESQIHIIDFQIAQGSQWVTLIQALADRTGGPPRICITGIDDARGGLDIVGKRLSLIAESCKVPFEFHALPISGSQVEIQDLKIQPGVPLAVNFPLMLHHMPDESVSVQNHRDRLLRLVKSLSPKIVTLVEQESNTNTAPFFPRFVETLNYYLAIFESIDVTLPREHKERINVEQHCLAREIVNIIACEGAERVERHEPLGKWQSRFSMAGFRPYPLNSVVNSTIKTLLKSYSENYSLEERDGVLYLGWGNQDLVASCAWK
ncbi:hypothetical protein NMG60_11002130 [Bertholletia excelsa]